jgi:hypothetical protein
MGETLAAASAAMTARDIYGAAVAEEKADCSDLFGCYYSHMPEVPGEVALQARDRTYWAANALLVEKTHYRRQSDARRFHAVRSYWLNGVPFLVTLNAGREGDDYARRFVTDRAVYAAAVSHVRALYRPPASDPPGGGQEVRNDFDPLPELGDFYGRAVGPADMGRDYWAADD